MIFFPKDNAFSSKDDIFMYLYWENDLIWELFFLKHTSNTNDEMTVLLYMVLRKRIY